MRNKFKKLGDIVSDGALDEKMIMDRNKFITDAIMDCCVDAETAYYMNAIFYDL